MFITPDMTVFGGRGFSIGGGGGVLKYATGYPLTLTKTLAKPPESITVYGASGGVGDRTTNLFGKSISYANPASSLPISRAAYLDAGTYTLRIPSFTAATSWRLCFKLWDANFAQTTTGVRVKSSSGYTSYYTNNDNYYIMSNNTDQKNYTMVFELTSGRYIAFSLFYGNTTSASRANNVMINSGSTALPYEPYGYRIPILINPPILPSGYTKLEYIESTGTQYINTGVNSDNNLKIKLKVMGTKSISFGVYAYGSGESRLHILGNSLGWSSSALYNAPISYLVTENVWEISKDGFVLNGDKLFTPSTYTFKQPAELYLFARHTKNNSGTDEATNYSSFKLAECVIYNGDTLIRNFIPARRNSDNIVGMYDTVNNVFYANGNASGDNFVAGAEIPNKTINLYTDSALSTGESLVVNPTAQTAMRGSMDVSALQDWTQDWKIPKADSLTVTAGTTVTPDKLDMAYMSKDKAWRIYGASGGVGDRTANLFDKLTATWLNGKRYSSDGTYANNAHQTTIPKFPMSAKQITISFVSKVSNTKFAICEFNENGRVSKYENGFSSPRTITLQAATTKIGMTFYTSGDVNDVKDTDISNIMITEGSTGAPYEPYGYKIPLVISDGTTDKTIKLYSDAALGANDSLVVSPTAQTASRGSTDVAVLQDWTQDWKVPKADSLTVSAGTTVQPSSMEIEYYGKR